ncbi:MAG TPA: roadblock/LC7 domain-containing protein [Gemmatimonadales bacterium]|nr:roadblock/LC7 domain-containing protein [Gemmatimonadales bacterium]
MPTISGLLDDLAARPGVLGVLVLSDDGLSVAQAGNDPAADELAAVGSAALRQLGQLGASTRQGKLQIGVVEYESGRVVIHPVRDDASLLLLVRRDVNVGTLLFELSAEAEALAALL